MVVLLLLVLFELLFVVSLFFLVGLVLSTGLQYFTGVIVRVFFLLGLVFVVSSESSRLLLQFGFEFFFTQFQIFLQFFDFALHLLVVVKYHFERVESIVGVGELLGQVEFEFLGLLNA